MSEHIKTVLQPQIDPCNLLQRALTDVLAFFSVPLNPLTSSTSLDLLVEYDLFINTL